jgi:hypothetical protein
MSNYRPVSVPTNVQLQTSVSTNYMSNYRPVSVPTACPITDHCQYKWHVQLQTSVSTNGMSNYRPVQYELHVQLQKRITACCMSKYRPVSLLTRQLSPLTEFYKIFEMVICNGVNSFFNLNNVAGE